MYGGSGGCTGTVADVTDLSPFGIVTPEAVLLDLPAAGVATRMMAKAVDLFCQLCLTWGVSVGIVLLAGGGGSLAGVVIGVIAFLIWFVVPCLVETFSNGRSPGKSMLGLRVVTLDGGPVMFRHAFLRAVCFIPLDLVLGLIPAVATRRSQRFGDLLAGTFVLVERNPAAGSTPIAFYPPPGCEHYVAALDVGRVTAEQYRLLRAFLLRVGQLDGSARGHLAVRLAVSLVARTSPPPPAGLPPEIVLVCIASAYQYRNGGLPSLAQLGGRWVGPPPALVGDAGATPSHS